jgi:peptidoglycan/LPS O-acetylase OafA/YrhL
MSFAVYALGPSAWTKVYHDKSVYDIIALTPLAWGWMFGLGILAVKHFELVRRWAIYLPWLALPLVILAFAGNGLLFGSNGNRLGLLYFACYAGLVLWLAFFTPYVRLRADLSYGVYIWHVPAANLLLVLGHPEVLLFFFLTLGFAALSWFLVEKPALSLKRKSLHPIERPLHASAAIPGGRETIAGE